MAHLKKFLKPFLCLILVSVFSLSCLSGCGSSWKVSDEDGPVRVCVVTDAAGITDMSFNQSTYEAALEYCQEHNVPLTYKQPENTTTYSREAMIDLAVAEGYNVIFMPGYQFSRCIVDRSNIYPDVKFIGIDVSEGDLISAAVGNDYYSDPSAYKASDYYNTDNTVCIVYQEQIPGFMAGYAAVKLGYRKLGFLGGMESASVIRFGYGYLQGIEAAAKELNCASDIEVNYAYSGQFYGSTEITAVMDTWYSNGTEAVFVAAGSAWTSAADSASRYDKKVIGVDTDQAPIIDAYGEDMTVTSAMKKINVTVTSILESICETDTWKETYCGKIASLGLMSADDEDENFVGLPEDTQWSDSFTEEDYEQLVADIYNGKYQISSDTSTLPTVSYTLNKRDGTIM